MNRLALSGVGGASPSSCPEYRTRTSPAFGGLHFVALLLLSALGVGCASPSPDDDDETSSVSAELGSSVVQPNGGYVAHVTAAGSGCPAGSWVADISPDGQTFTITFSAYEVKVVPGRALDVKQCLINVGLRDPQGFPLSFALGSFHHQGYVLLDTPGMRAARSTSYVFGGKGSGAAPGFSAPAQRREIVGPYEDSYLQSDTVFTNRWSPCAAVSNLVVNSTLMLQNDLRRTGSGYVNTASVDGGMKLAFRLDWRRC
jgi:hypothetical protein